VNLSYKKKLDCNGYCSLGFVLFFALFISSFSAFADDDLEWKANSSDQEGSHETSIDKGFTFESLDGSYVIIGVGRAKNQGTEVLLGVINFDGEGNLAGTITSNSGPALSPRVITKNTISGTYSIGSVGRGIISFDSLGDATFVVTKSKKGKGFGKELEFFMNEVSSLGNLIGGKIISRNIKTDFTRESLDGEYGFVYTGEGSPELSSSVGIVNVNSEADVVAGDFILNVPNPMAAGRVLINFLSDGPFVINPDGTGTTESSTTGDQSHFVITKTKFKDNVQMAMEVFFAPEFSDPAGNFGIATWTRR